MTTAVSKWGNSLGVRVPKALAEEARLAEGDAVTISVQDGVIVIAAVAPTYRLKDLVGRITDKNRPAAADWGPAVGREIW